jgi:hypothetical protein
VEIIEFHDKVVGMINDMKKGYTDDISLQVKYFVDAPATMYSKSIINDA